MTTREFGVNVNTRAPLLYPEDYPVPALLDLGVAAERLGFDSVWAGDNYFSTARFECIAVLSGIAARTARVKLGTACLIAPLRNTIWLAVGWATLDQLSGGRTILNMCVGGGIKEAGGVHFSNEFQAAGVDYRKRGHVLADQIRVLRALWTDKEVNYASEFHTLRGVRLETRPAQAPCPPIWIASNPQIFGVGSRQADEMMKRVGTLADGWMSAAASPAEYRRYLAMVRDHAARAGRDPRSLRAAYQMTITVDPDRSRARREGLEFVNRYYHTDFPTIEGSLWERDPFGTPEECRDHIFEMMDAGVETFCFRFAARHQLRQVELFSQEVLPSLRKAAA